MLENVALGGFFVFIIAAILYRGRQQGRDVLNKNYLHARKSGMTHDQAEKYARAKLAEHVSEISDRIYERKSREGS